MQPGILLVPKIDQDNNMKLVINRSSENGSQTGRSSTNMRVDLATLLNRASALKNKSHKAT